VTPGHEAIRILGELDELARKQPARMAALEAMHPKLRDMAARIRGVLIASGGPDGCGVRQRPANENRRLGWCGLCGAYHELGEG